jgi:hypothetical protein
MADFTSFYEMIGAATVSLVAREAIIRLFGKQKNGAGEKSPEFWEQKFDEIVEKRVKEDTAAIVRALELAKRDILEELRRRTSG